MQLFCAAACFLFTSFTPLQASELGWSWCNLAPDRKFLFTYGCSTTSTELACGLDSRACYVTHPCSLRNFLKVAILHYFPSRVVRCLLRCVYSFTYGNIQRLEQLHLRSDEFF